MNYTYKLKIIYTYLTDYTYGIQNKQENNKLRIYNN